MLSGDVNNKIRVYTIMNRGAKKRAMDDDGSQSGKRQKSPGRYRLLRVTSGRL